MTIAKWQPWCNGVGARRWFLGRETTEGMEYHQSKSGNLVRYASFEGAQKAADRANQRDGG